MRFAPGLLWLIAPATACLNYHLQIAATAFVVAWAVRLGGFLVVRVWKTGHDSRFDEAKNKPFTFWIYWTMQVGHGGPENHPHS